MLPPRALTLLVMAIWLCPPRLPAMEHVTIPAASIGRDTSEALILRPVDPENSRRYPTVYLLHSFTGNAREWAQLGISEAAANLPIILVMLDGKQDFFSNLPDGPAWETHLLKEVIPQIDSHFPTLARPTSRALLGLSMGGHAALRLTLTQPDTFSIGASISGFVGCFETDSPGQVGEKAADLSSRLSERALAEMRLLPLLENRAPSQSQYFFLECGSNDPWLAEHRAWTKTAAAHDFHYEYRESPGKHDYAYWRETLRTLLPRVNDQLQRHHRDWQRNTSWEPLLGKWTSVAVIPDGELSFTTLFEIKDGRLSGQSEGGPDGVQTFDRIQFEDGSLNYRSYQRERIIEVRAEMTKEGTFVGEWIVANPQGQPAASGEWRASRTLTE